MHRAPLSIPFAPTGPTLSRALGLLFLGAVGCSPSPWPAALVPMVSLVLDHQLSRGQRPGQGARRLGSLSVRVLLTFDGAALRPVLPSALDVTPALYALPCADDDATCMVELAPDHSAVARAYGDAP